MGKQWKQCQTLFFGAPKSLQMVIAAMKLRDAYSLEGKLTFSSPVATAQFSKFAGILSVALSQHHLLGFEIAPLEFHHLH